jgi:predicted dinucleotide-binding enzyme
VVVSNSRGPETLSGLVAELGPKARAGTPEDAARAGDIVVVTIPLKHYRTVPVAPLAGKIVIDTNNYYPERDGHIKELDNESTTVSELLQAHLPTAKVVKAFNHIQAAQLTTDGRPAGTANRRGLVIAGDDEPAKAEVTRLLDQFGFDTVDAGPLKEGWRIQRDTPGYGPRRTARAMGRAERRPNCGRIWQARNAIETCEFNAQRSTVNAQHSRVERWRFQVRTRTRRDRRANAAASLTVAKVSRNGRAARIPLAVGS